MAEATNKTFVTQMTNGTYQEGVVMANMDSADTITVDSDENKVAVIKSAFGHVADTGEVLQFSYNDNVITLETASKTGIDVVVRILY